MWGESRNIRTDSCFQGGGSWRHELWCVASRSTWERLSGWTGGLCLTGARDHWENEVQKRLGFVLKSSCNLMARGDISSGLLNDTQGAR